MPKTPHKANYKLGYSASLDGLRGIAVLAVITLHAYIPIKLPYLNTIFHTNIKIFGVGGFLGVDIFFVLSGFLITALLVQEWESNEKIDFKKFYLRRSLRLLPALVVFVLASVLYSVLFRDSQESAGAVNDIFVIAFYLSNWIPINIYSLRHLWSLAVEEQFYLLYPILLLVLMLFINRLKLHRRWIIFFLLGLIAVIAVHRAQLFGQLGFTNRTYQATDVRADSLLVGCLAALLVSWDMIPKSLWFLRFVKVGAIVSIFSLLFVILTLQIDNSYLYYGGFTVIAFSVGLIIISLQNSPPKILKSIFEWSVLVWIGRLSYGIYLWHKLVYMIIDALPVSVQIPSYTMQRIVLPFTIKIGCSLSVAAISFYCLEKPFLRLKKRFAVVPAVTGNLAENNSDNAIVFKSPVKIFAELKKPIEEMELGKAETVYE